MDIKEIIKKLEKDSQFKMYHQIMNNILNDMTNYDLACATALIKLAEETDGEQFDLDLTFYEKTIKQIGNLMFLVRMINGFALVSNGDRLINNYIDSIYSKKEKGVPNEQSRSIIQQVKET